MAEPRTLPVFAAAVGRIDADWRTNGHDLLIDNQPARGGSLRATCFLCGRGVTIFPDGEPIPAHAKPCSR